MEPDSGRLVFRIGDAFPADNPIAVFVTTLSIAWSDLMFVNKRLVGGDDDVQFQDDVPETDQFYLLRASIAHLRELRDLIAECRDNEPDVRHFLDGLDDSVKERLDHIMVLSTDEEDWIEKAVDYIRHKTNHYDRGATRWALSEVADEEGSIVMRNQLNSGAQLEFAELAALQHFVKFPIGNDDPEAAFSTLAKALAAATGAAIDCVTRILNAYLDTLPEGVERVET